MVDPEKLWQGTLQVLGDLARAYQPPPPVARERLVAHDQVDLPGLTVVPTPGHAPHHVAYLWQGNLFPGEASGNLFQANGGQYLRPATPPRFLLEETVASVDRLLELPDSPAYFAHASQAPHSHDILNRFRRQLFRWLDIIAAVEPEPADTLHQRCVETLLTQDPELKAIEKMTSGEQQRERTFIVNSVRGYLGYLHEQAGNQ